ncbi:hypothetical protein J6590_074653 [Homalodisca vitripennis]|nr:hypothetical protein J6590_074653 [Homalodisca vitripennis]
MRQLAKARLVISALCSVVSESPILQTENCAKYKRLVSNDAATHQSRIVSEPDSLVTRQLRKPGSLSALCSVVSESSILQTESEA